ncbi:MAG: RHS repeat protein [Pseudomonadota bacterium]
MSFAISGVDFLFTSESNIVDRFSDGRLVERTGVDGRSVQLAYDGFGRLVTVIDDDGNTLTFAYNSDDQISTITHPAGQLQYTYDSNNNLVSVTREDAAVRHYHYEDSAFPHHLTGITNELSNRFATWTYDSSGRAISSEHAGSTDLVTLSYSSGYTEVTDASGGVRQYNIGNAGQSAVVTSVTGDKCIDCPHSGAASRTYDSNGYLDEVTDWNGNITDYDHDSRGLETQRIEAKGTALERTITTIWHASLRLPLQIVEPERITNFTYTSSGALLSKQVLPNPGTP